MVDTPYRDVLTIDVATAHFVRLVKAYETTPETAPELVLALQSARDALAAIQDYEELAAR